MMKLINVGQDASCNGGTWSFAGNGRQYATAYIAPSFLKFQLPTPQYRSGLNLFTLASQAGPYAKITISGPGITTKAAASTTTGSVDVVPASNSLSQYNVINDSFYGSGSVNAYTGLIEGTSQLLDCSQVTSGQPTNGNWGVAATGSTPCLNSTAATAGSDYVITVKDSGGATLEKFNQRLTVAPTTVIPTTWYPTITSITPAGSTIGAGGGSASFQWSLPTGAQAVQVFCNIHDSGIRTLRNIWAPVASAATSATLATGPMPSPGSLPGIPSANTSYGFVSATLNGIMITSALPY